MYRRDYKSGTEVWLYDGNTLKYKVKCADKGSYAECTIYNSNDVECVIGEGEPINTLKYINISLSNIKELIVPFSLNDIVVNESNSIDSNANVVVVYSDFRFEDGSRETVYFYVVKKSLDGERVLQFNYYLQSLGSGSGCSIKYTIKSEFNGAIDKNPTNSYVLIMDNGVPYIKRTKEKPNVPYCLLFKEDLSLGNMIVNELGENSIVDVDGDNLIYEGTFNDDNEYYISYKFDPESVGFNEFKISRDLYNHKKLDIKNNTFSLDINEFKNGVFYVSKFVNDGSNVKYSYVSSGAINLSYPKITLDIHKHNNEDLDYVINDGDRATNYYKISDDVSDFGKALVLLKDSSAVNSKVYDVPMYDAKVSSFISNDMYDDGYNFGDINVRIGSKEKYYELESYNDSTTSKTYDYVVKTETFKVNPSNISVGELYLDEISSTNNMLYEERYYIKSKDNKYLNYSSDDINNSRIVYYKG